MSMRPLNGVARMTREEARARRKELKENPFVRAMYLRTRNSWYARNKDRINQKRRQRYSEDAEFRQRVLRRMAEKNRTVYAQKKSESGKAYYRRNREKVLARIKERSLLPEVKARHDASLAKRRERYRTDPVFREKVRAQRRAQWNRWKHSSACQAKALRNHFIPYWKSVVEGGPGRISEYMRRARPKNREAFARWYSGVMNLLDRTSPCVNAGLPASEIRPETPCP